MVVRLLWEHEVAGSNPACPTSYCEGRQISKATDSNGQKNLTGDQVNQMTLLQQDFWSDTSQSRFDLKVQILPFTQIF